MPETFQLRSFITGFLLLVLPISCWLAYDLSLQSELRTLQTQSSNKLALFTENLKSEIEKYEFLPRVLATDQEIIQLLRQPNAQRLDRINRKLEKINLTARVSDTYLMQPNGNTIAASNWQQSVTFIGKNFGFRPYFKDAMLGENGRYFALGTTSNKRGFYFSSPIYDDEDDTILGVVVVKVSMETLERAWQGNETRVFITDRYNIIFSGNTPEWHFRSLYPLRQEHLQHLSQSKQYRDIPLRPLDLHEISRRVDALPLVRIKSDGDTRYTTYLLQEHALDHSSWHVFALMNTRPAYQAAWLNMALVAFALLALMLTISLLQLHVQEKIRVEARIAEKLRDANDKLESRVKKRTQELEHSNQHLQREINLHQQTEQQLRTTQNELIQAGKLAVLGQISAGITHELNQPLTALRTYAANACTFIARDRCDKADENLQAIIQLTERMATITSHLKTFSRKSSDTISPVNLRCAIDNSLALVNTQRYPYRVNVEVDVDAATTVASNDVRLEQVLINLIKNAFDAMHDTPQPQLAIHAEQDAQAIILRLQDNGPGISKEHIEKLFDPFFTTKEVGEGLGLGLTISYEIMQSLGGKVRVENHPSGGAIFELILPLVENDKKI